MPRLPFFQLGSFNSDDPNWACQRTVNMYPELAESEGAKSQVRLRGTAGLASLGQVGSGPIRGMWAGGERLFVVSGGGLYEVFSNGSANHLGNVSGGTEAAYLAANGRQLMVVSGGKVYIHTGIELLEPTVVRLEGKVDIRVGQPRRLWWKSGDRFDPLMVGETVYIEYFEGTESAVVTAVSPVGEWADVDRPQVEGRLDVGYYSNLRMTASTGTFLDGYFIVSRPQSRQVNISSLYDGLTWDPSDFGLKEGYPDHVARVFAHQGDLWVIGYETAEVWRNTGAELFPFERMASGFIPIGCVSPETVVRFGNGVAWLGRDDRGRVAAYVFEGYSPHRASTGSVEREWGSYSDLSSSTAISWRDGGHEFWQINFPTTGKSWVFDLSTRMWHERMSGNGVHRARCHAYVWNKSIVGDYQSGTLYVMDPSYTTEAGQPITRMRQAGHISGLGKRIYYHEFQLDVQAGSGGSVELQWSDDDAATFFSAGSRSFGGPGETRTRVTWRRLGQSRDRVFRLISTSPVLQSWSDAYIEYREGNH